MPASPTRLRLVEQLYDAEQRRAHHRGDLAELDELCLDLRRKLSRWVQPGFWRIGEFLVGRTEVEPEPSIDVKAAIAEGAVEEAVLEPFKRDREPYERWTIRRRRRARERKAA